MMTRYCACGEPVSAEERWNGLATVYSFRHNETGQIITHCPRCGQHLRYKELTIEPPEEQDHDSR